MEKKWGDTPSATLITCPTLHVRPTFADSPLDIA